MTSEPDIDIPAILEDEPRVQKALRGAVQKAIRTHKLMGVPIVVWEDGKVVEIPPEKIELLDDPQGNGAASPR